MSFPEEEQIWSWGLCLPEGVDREDFPAFMDHLANALEGNPDYQVRSLVIEQEWDDTEKYNNDSQLEMPWTARVNQAPA